MMLSRRELFGLLAGAVAAGSRRAWARAAAAPVRRLTNGPRFHWFGYYDKWQFDPDNRYVLGCEVGFEHRTPSPDDEIRIGMVDLRDGDRWIDLGALRV